MTTRISRKKLRDAAIIASLVTLFAVIANVSGLSALWERKTIDIRTALCRSGTVLSDDIAIILIDEASLQALNDMAGRWPWARFIHGELIDYLSLCGAKAVVMDITFSENQINTLTPNTTIDTNDARLVEATRRAGNVIHAMQITQDIHDEINMDLLNTPLPDIVTQSFALNVDVIDDAPENNMYYLPFKELLEASSGLGVVTFVPDADGVSRSEQLLYNYQNHFFPAHSLAPILMTSKYSDISINRDSIVLSGEALNDIRIPVDKNKNYFANMYGHYNTFSYSGVIESWMKIQQGITDNLMVPPEDLQDKIIFVGASAAATRDLKRTSIGYDIPGVFLHASMCGNILNRDFLKFTGFFSNMLMLVPLLFFCVFCVFFMKKIYLQIYLPLGLVILYAGLAILLFNVNIVIHLAVPIISVFAAYVISFGYISFTEGKEKRKVKNILGQYVSPAMLNQVLDHSKDEYLKAEVGSKEYLTVFFSDIRGFTSISEQYPVEKVVEVLNAYLSAMVDIIFEHKGTLDKFIGDAVVAFWGAPVRFEDHSYQAVVSALNMQTALDTLNETNSSNDLPQLSIGIGIHADHVILGNIGSRKKLDYTVIGDGVNLTSRLEGLTKTYGVPILISQSCYDQVKDQICCRIADFVKVKGKNEPITIYHPMGEYETLDPWDINIAEKTNEAFTAYQNGDFDTAKAIYENILTTETEDGLARLFAKRCEELSRKGPDSDWSGCFVHQTK